MTEHDRVTRVLETQLSRPAPPRAGLSNGAIDETIGVLASDRARTSLKADAYWPKWDTPWWRMTLLFELGLAGRIPATAVQSLLETTQRQYIDHFPVRIEEVPAGVDPVLGLLCHCALGTLDRVLGACGVDVDRELPYVRGWYARYMLPDGGYNCDEAAYTKATPRSSVVSSMPPLEALMGRSDLTPAEELLVDRGARYLLDRKLCRSLSKGGAHIDPTWLEPTFPRFYEYDVLRGLTFVVRWALRRGVRLPAVAVVEAVEEVARRVARDGSLAPHRRAWQGATTLAQTASGAWTRGHPARTFPLLEEAGAVGCASDALTREWRGTLEALGQVLD